MRAPLLLAVVLLAAAPALAAEGSAPPPAASSNAVDMPILVAPMAVDGKLLAYAYLHASLEAAGSSAVFTIRDKTPFLQDAFIRDVNGAPIGEATAPEKLDVPGLKARLLADARRVLGADKVKGLTFTQIQISPLRPGAAGSDGTAQGQ